MTSSVWPTNEPKGPAGCIFEARQRGGCQLAYPVLRFDPDCSCARRGSQTTERTPCSPAIRKPTLHSRNCDAALAMTQSLNRSTQATLDVPGQPKAPALQSPGIVKRILRVEASKHGQAILTLATSRAGQLSQGLTVNGRQAQPGHVGVSLSSRSSHHPTAKQRWQDCRSVDPCEVGRGLQRGEPQLECTLHRLNV